MLSRHSIFFAERMHFRRPGDVAEVGMPLLRAWLTHHAPGSLVGGRLSFCRDRSAVASIEFALIVPIFIALLLGVVEGANLYRLHGEMTVSARDAGRRLAVGSMEPAQVRQMILSRLQDITDADVTVSIQEREIDQLDSDVTIEVMVDMADAMIFDYFNASVENSDIETGPVATGPDGSNDEPLPGPDELEGRSMRLVARATMLKER